MTRRKVIALLPVVALVFSFLVGSMALAPSAHAAAARPLVSCSGTGCNGQQASTTGCNAGDTKLEEDSIYDGSLYLGSVSLYWSPTCKTNWSHMHNPGGYSAAVFVEQCYQGATQWYAGRYTYGAFDSPMVYSPTTTAYGSGNILDVSGYHFATTKCY